VANATTPNLPIHEMMRILQLCYNLNMSSKIMSKLIPLIEGILILALGYFIYYSFLAKQQPTDSPPYPIVDHFACSDNCPGPKEKYMVKIYQGVTDKDECLKIGGEPYTYTGWGTFNICLVK